MAPPRRTLMRAARSLIVSAALACLLPAGALARIVPVTPSNSIEVPDDWTSASLPNGVEVATPDGKARLRITLGPGSQAAIQAMVGAHQDHLASRGVTITGIVSERQMEQSGLRYITSELAATSGGERTVVNLVAIGVPGRPDRAAVVSLWMADIDAARRDMASMVPVMNSLFASLARR